MPARPRVDRLKTIYTAARQLNFGFRLEGFPSAPNENGIFGFKPQLHRLTIKFCKQNDASMGIRNFIETSLKQFAAENPQTVVYVIPGRNSIPILRAEYANGREVHINAKGFSLEQAEREVNALRTRSGEPIVKFISHQTAQYRSLQGQWSSLTTIDPKQNVSKLPSDEFNVHKTSTISATDYLLNLVKEQGDQPHLEAKEK